LGELSLPSQYITCRWKNRETRPSMTHSCWIIHESQLGNLPRVHSSYQHIVSLKSDYMYVKLTDCLLTEKIWLSSHSSIFFGHLFSNLCPNLVCNLCSMYKLC